MTRVLSGLFALAVCVAFVLALLLASRHGQQSRCAWLIDHQSPAATTYQCTTTGAP